MPKQYVSQPQEKKRVTSPVGRPSLVCCGLPLVPPIKGYTVYATGKLWCCSSCGRFYDRDGNEVKNA